MSRSEHVYQLWEKRNQSTVHSIQGLVAFSNSIGRVAHIGYRALSGRSHRVASLSDGTALF